MVHIERTNRWDNRVAVVDLVGMSWRWGSRKPSGAQSRFCFSSTVWHALVLSNPGAINYCHVVCHLGHMDFGKGFLIHKLLNLCCIRDFKVMPMFCEISLCQNIRVFIDSKHMSLRASLHEVLQECDKECWKALEHDETSHVLHAAHAMIDR